MIKYLKQISLTLRRVTHERGQGKIDHEDTKTNRQEQQRFELLGNGQIDKERTDGPHHYLTPFQIWYAR